VAVSPAPLLKEGRTLIVRSKDGRGLAIRVQREGHVDEGGLEDAPLDRIRLVSLDNDDAPDVVVDRGGTRTGQRFHVYLTAELVGIEDSLVWRWLVDAKNIDEAVTALKAIKQLDYSIPEVCGLLDRSSAKVEAWDWSDAAGWKRLPAKTKALAPGTCAALVPDGDQAYWMPEIACSKIAPACEIQLLSGGHGGTALPMLTQIFFDRVKGKLQVTSVAQNGH